MDHLFKNGCHSSTKFNTEPYSENIDEIYFYENTEPFRGKLGWNVSWIILVTMRSPSRTLKLNIRT